MYVGVVALCQQWLDSHNLHKKRYMYTCIRVYMYTCIYVYTCIPVYIYMCMSVNVIL